MTKPGTDAYTDFNGKYNTSEIINFLADHDDGKVYGAPAAEACVAYTFPNGTKGYLPALGELITVYNNKSAVSSAMSLIGGNALKKNDEYYWSSTQSGSSTSYSYSFMYGSINAYGYKSSTTCYVRAFSSL